MSLLPLDTTTPAQRIAALADQCVMCGLCQPHCPTYRLAGTESESPRGRIAIARALANGSVAPEPSVLRHLDQCLGCMSCERVCPSQVDYAGLLAATRELTRVRSRALPGWLRALFGRPRWLRSGVALARSIRAQRWMLPILRRFFPGSATTAALQSLPVLPALPRYASAPPRSESRGRIGLMRGCVASVFDRDTLAASCYLLQCLGYEVIEPVGNHCCGAMDQHAGDAGTARGKAQAMREVFEAARVDAVVVSATGCYGTLRDLTFGGNAIAVHEIHNFINADREIERLRFRPLAQRAALHVPCTAANVAHSGTATARLLARIPQLQLLPLPEQPRCCGAAGTYFLEHVDIALTLRKEKMDQCVVLAPDMLLTANIGCRIHLDNGLRERGSGVPVLHPITLLARQLDAESVRVPSICSTIDA